MFPRCFHTLHTLCSQEVRHKWRYGLGQLYAAHSADEQPNRAIAGVLHHSSSSEYFVARRRERTNVQTLDGIFTACCSGPS